jgi:hypothetical protein
MPDDLDAIREAPPAADAPAVIHIPPLPPLDGRDTGAALGETIKKGETGRGGQRRKGRHFGPKPVADPRRARLQIRCTRRVQEKAEAAAKDAGLTVSGLVVQLIDGTPGPRARRSTSELQKQLGRIQAELGKSGGNLNQTAKAHNELRNIAAVDGIDAGRLAEMDDLAAELRQAIADHRRAVFAVERALGLRLDDDHDY